MTHNNPQRNQGDHTEKQFSLLASQYGWTATPSSDQENMKDHIDFHLSKKDRLHPVDVKGMKALSRANAVVQDDWHVVEFIAVGYPRHRTWTYRPPFDPAFPDFTVGSGRPGWVYGKSDFIVFETKSHWLFIPPKELIAECIRIVDFNDIAPYAKHAQYKVYSRPERGDLITLVHKSDLRGLSAGAWNKNNM